METTEEYVFIPTEFGVVHAVRTDGSGIAWSHKVSHSAVTSLKKTGDHRLIIYHGNNGRNSHLPDISVNEFVVVYSPPPPGPLPPLFTSSLLMVRAALFTLAFSSPMR